VGICIWGNWLDEGSFESVLAFNNLNNPRKLWMGIWGHCQVGDFPMTTELLRFFDHFLKKVDNGWDREPPVYFRTVNAPEDKAWSSAQQWPLPDTHNQILHLSSAATPTSPGRLETSPPRARAASDRFTVDYDPKCKDLKDTYFIMWPCRVENHGLAYETEPLKDDIHIAGHPLVEVWLSTSTDDADLFVYLEHIDASGAEHIITHGRLRASLRSEQKPPYRTHLGLPYHRGNRGDAEPMKPGEPALLRLDLLPTSTLIKAGERLRLRFAGADPRQRSRTLQYSPPPVLGIHRDQKRSTRLHLPVLHGST
jgi:putative CocE/NonD family hydrolase